MAQPRQLIRRRSLERIRLLDDEEGDRAIRCAFCPERFDTAALLGEHLLTCGNKTDQCPLCHQFIRRAYFAYHYENNCAQVKDTATPPSANNRRESPRQPPNANQPVSREDISADPSKENSPPSIPARRPNPPPPGQQRTPVPLSPRNPVLLPIRDSPNPPRRAEPGNGIVHIPCEYCQQPIDLPNWSSHTRACRERDNRRLAQRAHQISQEPVTEAIPCEYCQQPIAAGDLRIHEENCRAANGRRSRSAFTPIDRPRAPRSQSAHRNNERPHYQSIDHDRTHQVNRSSADSPPRSLRRSNSADELRERPTLYENGGRPATVVYRGSSRGGRPAPDHYGPYHKSSSLERIDNRSVQATFKRKKASWWKKLLCVSQSNAMN